MAKINVLLTTANGNLVDKKKVIEAAVLQAQDYAFPRLHIEWDIDVLVTNRIPLLIPENGVGGYTFSSDFIRINIDDKKVTKELIAENIVHELCHAARWGKNAERMNSLFDNLIFEGIACCYEVEYLRSANSKSIFIRTILERTDEENEIILKELRRQLDSSGYDYDAVFFNGDDRIPQWAGYSLGYYLVKRYLDKTGKKIEEAFADKYGDFKACLLDGDIA